MLLTKELQEAQYNYAGVIYGTNMQGMSSRDVNAVYEMFVDVLWMPISE